MRMRALVSAALTLVTFTVSAQTNAKHSSTVGTWKLDVAKSNAGSEAPPKSVTLVILKDTPQACSWRVDAVDEKGQAASFSWSGPQDGSLHPVKDAKGQTIGQESLKLEQDGSLVRRGTDNDGNSFEAHAKLSQDGNTITDAMTMKTKDGKTVPQTWIYHRVLHGK